MLNRVYKHEPEWTIGIVNYKSSVYIKWQLKIIYESNNIDNFKLIIVDNSSPHEKKELEDLTKPYKKKYGNIEVFYYNPKEETASGQHGEALSFVKKKVKTKYFLVHDPDFFWVKKGYLKLFSNYLSKDKNNVCIGAPYPEKIGIGHPFFPAAYGCAYKTDDIRDIDFKADLSNEKRIQSFRDYPIEEGYNFSYDVGWEMRKKLSSQNFISFKQRDATELKKRIGVHSFQVISKEYMYKNKTIAFHLFRGTFTGHVTEDLKDPQSEVNKKWNNTRDKYGRFFYSYLLNKTSPNIIIRYFHVIDCNLYILKNKIRKKILTTIIKIIKKFLGHKIIYLMKKIIFNR